MYRFFVASVLAMLASVTAVAGTEKVSKEQIKGLDEQVQEIKTNALGIGCMHSMRCAVVN